jgi:hypothetical protein
MSKRLICVNEVMAIGVGIPMDQSRGERLQIMLTTPELTALDDWRFSKRMPSRAAAIRELLRRGLAAEGFEVSDANARSKDFSVLDEDDAKLAG